MVAILTSPYEVHVVCEPELYGAKPGTESAEAVTFTDDEMSRLNVADLAGKRRQHVGCSFVEHKLDASRRVQSSNPDDARNNPACKERMAGFADRYASSLLKNDHVDFQIVRSEVVADYTVTDSSATALSSDVAAPALEAAGAKLGFKVELNQDKTLKKASKQQSIVFSTEPLAKVPLRR